MVSHLVGQAEYMIRSNKKKTTFGLWLFIRLGKAWGIGVLFHLSCYRRVSHGLGWPANAILFLPIVKGNQKLQNWSAPTASNIAL